MLPVSNPAVLIYLFQVLSGEQWLPDEVRTPGFVKPDALQLSCRQEAPFADNRRKHGKITTIYLRGSDQDEDALFELTRSFAQLNL